MLRQLIDEMDRQRNAQPGSTDSKSLAASVELPQRTLQIVNDYLAGRSTLSPKDLFRKAISDSRGFSEIGAASTEMPGPIYDQIDLICCFSVERSRPTPHG